VALEERGIADIVSVTIMFTMLVLAGTAIHVVTAQPLEAASSRQLALRSEHVYRALEKANVDPYATSYLAAAAENLLLARPTVPGGYLRAEMKNVLCFLSSEGYSMSIRLTYGGQVWGLSIGEGEPKQSSTHWGTISVVRAEAEGERVLTVRAEVTIWR